MKSELRRTCVGLSIAGVAFSLAACSGKSSSGQMQVGGSAGQGASSADGSGTGGEAAGISGGNATNGGASGAGGNCPAGLDYFMSLEGDLPSRRLTQSCAEHETDASVPVFDVGDSLEASMQRFQAFIGCDGDERLEVWRVLHPNDDSAGGFYTAADGVTYSVCGTTSRAVIVTADCATKVGSVTFAQEASSKGVVEGSYAMQVYDDAGNGYAIHGDFRVCAYFLR